VLPAGGFTSFLPPPLVGQKKIPKRYVSVITAMAEDMDEGDAPDAAPATPAPLPAPRPPRGPKKPTAAVDADGWQTVGPRRG